MKFEFFKDTLGTIWYRDCVKIEANSYEEAKQKMIDAVKYDDDELEIIWCEPIWETWNETTTDDNDEFSTLEIQEPETGKIIYKNGK